MNDPITLAATAQDDDPREPHAPGPTSAPTPTGTAPVRTLPETAGTCRPLEEVAQPVNLLEETGPGPGHGHQTLRAAAVGRPVQDVALPVGILGTDEDRVPPPGPAPTAQGPEPAHPVPPAPPGSADRSPGADQAVPVVPSVHPARPPAVPAVPVGPRPQDGRRYAQRPEPPAEEPFDDPYDDERYESLTEYRRKYGRGPDGNRTAAAPAPSGPLRHRLRRPVAAALLVCGVLHLPGDVTALSSETPTAFLPLLATVLCLGLGALIAARDTAGAWRAGAVGALAVVVLHVVGGLAAFDPLEGAVSASQTWAGVAAVFCAAAAAVLAGLALGNRTPRARAGAGG
ncbi:hypothetical protein ACFXGI_07100 [Streptomyces sp. NPDC059355]|uniref:hypothetical protein n=1 Tax=Streptomyces sp. NPDC059355 TaxID=3346811 RepID=UPI00368CB284